MANLGVGDDLGAVIAAAIAGAAAVWLLARLERRILAAQQGPPSAPPSQALCP